MHAALAAYQHILADTNIEVVQYSESLRDAAIDLYQKSDDKDWGVTDCISFIVMRQRKLTHALTADHHFEQAGFIALLLHDP